ncbi:hypothetical protein ScPMuIL_001711 [Solemya velum]
MTSQSALPQVQFRASNHGDTVLAGLMYLRDKQQLFDVVLVVQEERLPAHRVVLASCSDYFRAMFTNGLLECQQEEVCLNGVTAKGMESLIDFAYTSKLSLNLDNIEDVLTAANHVQMLPVLKACVNYLKNHMCLENCVDIVSIAELYSLKNLKKCVQKYICANFSKLAISKEILKLSLKQIHEILDVNFPVDCSECEILSSVLDWSVLHHESLSSSGTTDLLSNIKFGDISSGELERMPNYPIFKKITEEKSSALLCKISTEMKNAELDNIGLINKRGFQQTVVVAGGFSPRNGMTNEIQYMHRDECVWKELTKIPHIQQCNFGLAVLENKLYVVGGCYNDNMQEVVHPYGFCFSPLESSWTPIAPMLLERCRFFLGSSGGHLYAVGGDPSATDDITSDSASCERYDPQNNTWATVSPLPGNRMQHAGISSDLHLYISGGVQDADDVGLRDFYQYDTQTDSWTMKASLLTPRADHSMYIYEKCIYIVGGWFQDPQTWQREMASTIDRYVIDDDRWETITTVPTPRLYATYTVLDGKLYVIGGWLNGDYQRKAQQIQMYDLSTGRWHDEDNISLEVWEHSSTVMYIPKSIVSEEG